uniref:Uncharacterized protein n=1 Tax=Cajanus cajan TaxID=3821 RepID=A0A151R455_CAJCA|nr:hypothetical protein KK1_041423 [Cajanus cajan]
MAMMSFLFNCFVSSSSSPLAKVSDSSQLNLKSTSSEKPTKSKGAPLVVSYFPVNYYPSRL